MTETSNCCNADMREYPDSDMCPKCKEHCVPTMEDIVGDSKWALNGDI